MVRTLVFFNILTSKCASRHNGVHFFHIGTSKSGPNVVCFVHFDLEMCFAPQRRTLFRHLNFQKWSERGVLCTFWLGNVLREMCFATQRRALFRRRNFQKWSDAEVFCTFWLGNVLRATTHALFRHRNFQKWSDAKVFCTFWLGCVLRAISHLASWLRTRRFSEPTFWPSGATNHWKNTPFRDFPTFSRTCIFFFFWLFPFSDLILLPFSSLTLPTSAFPPVHIVGSLTSKLPSFIYIYILYIYILYIYYINYIYIYSFWYTYIYISLIFYFVCLISKEFGYVVINRFSSP